MCLVPTLTASAWLLIGRGAGGFSDLVSGALVISPVVILYFAAPIFSEFRRLRTLHYAVTPECIDVSGGYYPGHNSLLLARFSDRIPTPYVCEVGLTRTSLQRVCGTANLIIRCADGTTTAFEELVESDAESLRDLLWREVTHRSPGILK
jgi:membrane protein YdbS with pleckstrin-like domain